VKNVMEKELISELVALERMEEVFWPKEDEESWVKLRKRKVIVLCQLFLEPRGLNCSQEEIISRIIDPKDPICLLARWVWGWREAHLEDLRRYDKELLSAWAHLHEDPLASAARIEAIEDAWTTAYWELSWWLWAESKQGDSPVER